MLTDQQKQVLAELKPAIHQIEGITRRHARELERSLECLTNAFTETPDVLATWTHVTIIVEPEWFASAGYDISGLTKPELDELADEMHTYWVTGSGFESAVRYGARGLLAQAEQTDEAAACACCQTEKSFVPDPHGVCAICGDEHTDHKGYGAS